MKRTQGQGYICLPDARETSEEALGSEEEGNGRAHVEDADEDHVRIHFTEIGLAC